MKIKQWLANWLLKGVRIEHHDETEGWISGHILFGQGWTINIPGELGPAKPPAPPYFPKYNTRTPLEHQAIREKIQRDPSSCKHLKGGRTIGDTKLMTPVQRDYNVLTHTFPNGKTRIRCANCSRIWWSTDPDWQDALKMFNQSTNSPSSSEFIKQVTVVTSPGSPRVVFQDKLE